MPTIIQAFRAYGAVSYRLVLTASAKMNVCILYHLANPFQVIQRDTDVWDALIHMLTILHKIKFLSLCSKPMLSRFLIINFY